jgi:hypothetical protein
VAFGDLYRAELRDCEVAADLGLDEVDCVFYLADVVDGRAPVSSAVLAASLFARHDQRSARNSVFREVP